jgi:hypothetical protein
VLLALYGARGAFGIIHGAFAIIRGGSSIIRGAFPIYIRGAFAIIRSGSSTICGAFNIIRDASLHSTLFPYYFRDMYMI